MADTGRGVVACYPPRRNLTIGRDPLAKLKGSAREWHPSSDRNCGARTFGTTRRVTELSVETNPVRARVFPWRSRPQLLRDAWPVQAAFADARGPFVVSSLRRGA
jgi:hypothetical protein